jgi:hypothetical protein
MVRPLRQLYDRRSTAPGDFLSKAGIGQGLAVVTTISEQHADWPFMLRFGWYQHSKIAANTFEEIVDRIISAGCVCSSSANFRHMHVQTE